MDVAQVAKLTGLPTERVQQLKETGADSLVYVDPLAGFIGAVSHGSLAQQPDVELYGS